MEIKEVFDDIKDSVGDKGFFILIGGALLFGLYSFFKSDSSAESTAVSAPVAYASYPDAVTNADVIISSLQNSLEYMQGEIMESAETQHQETLGTMQETQEYLEQSFTDTNGYISEGFESMKELSDLNMSTIMGGLSDVESEISGANNDLREAISNAQSSILNNQNTNANAIIKNQNSATDKLLNNQNTNANSIIKNQNTNANSIIKNQNTNANKIIKNQNANTTKTVKTVKTIPATSYKGISIVDGLKASGINSSYSYRKKLAKANGISNYTGTAKQNTALLNKLKKGTLLRA